MNHEKGSLSILGLFSVIGLLTTATVLLNASSLYLQQRQLNNLSDSLALDLADLLQHSDYQQTLAAAKAELSLLNVSDRETELKDLQVSTPKVEVVLCQQPEVIFYTLGLPSSQVCARSVATAN